jgi:DNA modification methylase
MNTVIAQSSGENWTLWNADCIEVINSIPENSLHLSIFSPPYASLYTYSNSDRDMGNSSSDRQFYEHFDYLVAGLHRATMPGRIVCVDVMNIPAMKERDGFIGLKDFRGDIIRAFQRAGFVFHSEHCAWKDPLIEATRTKALGLMHKQLCKDSTRSRAGIPQYLLAFKKPGDAVEPVAHETGLEYFVGENPPVNGNLSHERWRRYASPVWMDINFSNTLNAKAAREADDERHVCPMALDLIERAIHLWSNPGDVIFDPYSGIGSTGYMAIKTGRKFVGSELKAAYFKQACKNIGQARESLGALFDGLDAA